MATTPQRAGSRGSSRNRPPRQIQASGATEYELIKANAPAHGTSIRSKSATESRVGEKFIALDAASFVRKGKLGEFDMVVSDRVIAAAGPRSIYAMADAYAISTPEQRMRAERRGVAPKLVKSMAKTLKIPNVRFYQLIGIPKATAEKKASTDTPIAGAAGQSALGVIRLLGIANSIVANSDATEAEEFDTAKWLGQWLERPQPALGGRKPADILDTPTGIDTVAKLLGAIESGAYL